MRYFIKIVLLIILTISVGANYRFTNLMGNSSTSTSQDYSKPDWIKTAEILLTINKIEYYENPFQSGHYVIFVDTKYNGTQTTSGNKDIIKALDLASILNRKLSPQKISTFPLWLAAIIALIIIFFPKSRKKQYNNENINDYRANKKNEESLKKYINEKRPIKEQQEENTKLNLSHFLQTWQEHEKNDIIDLVIEPKETIREIRYLIDFCDKNDNIIRTIIDEKTNLKRNMKYEFTYEFLNKEQAIYFTILSGTVNLDNH